MNTKIEKTAQVKLTESFDDIVNDRAKQDQEFADALLKHGIQDFIDGNVDSGKSMVRQYINATIGFESLGRATDTSPKSLMRMFSKTGNPQANNLFPILAKLQEKTGVKLEVKAA